MPVVEENENEEAFEDPERFDITDQDPRPETPPPPNGPREPRSPSSPSIQVVRTFYRNDMEQCVMPDGTVLTRYEHDRLVTIATRNKLFRSMGVIPDEEPPVEPPVEREENNLPPDFVMPPRRVQPARAAANAYVPSSISFLA